MSNIYIQEPPTEGKVLLTTTLGDIDIELWSREAPKACRNFVQLCLEGYYNGTIFHRVIKDFIAQGGDPTGTGEGGESVYGKPFRNEIHTRLRFVRRGLVAMANTGKEDNESQFFFTLGPTQELQGKHTVFGKVSGDTIYNLIKVNDIHTDSNDRPVEPPKIKKTEVLSNPFDDIIPREVVRPEKKEHKPKKSHSKGKKDFKLLSFGEEAEEDEELNNKVVETMRSKGKSAHDLTDDPRLSSTTGNVESVEPEEVKEISQEVSSQVHEELRQSSISPKESHSQSSSKLEELRNERKALQREVKGVKNKAETKSIENESKTSISKAVEEFNREKKEFLQKKKQIPKKGSSKRELETLALLDKFRSKLNSAQRLAEEHSESKVKDNSAPASSNKDGDDEEETDEGWMSCTLEFGDSHAKVLDANVTDVDRYEIYDPRNPMTKRRREEAKHESKRQKKEKEQVL